MTKVILSTKLIIGEGLFLSRSVSLVEAQKWVVDNNPINFCGHQTVKLVGLTPATTRDQCVGYTEALCLSAKGRLDFGREYTVEEIEDIGVDFTLVTFIDETTALAVVNEWVAAGWSAGLENYPPPVFKDVGLLGGE